MQPRLRAMIGSRQQVRVRGAAGETSRVCRVQRIIARGDCVLVSVVANCYSVSILSTSAAARQPALLGARARVSPSHSCRSAR